MKSVKRLLSLSLNHRCFTRRSSSTKCKITTLNDFVKSNRQCIEFEKLAEKERIKIAIEGKSIEDLCASGSAVGRLKFVNYHTSPDGRVIARFLQLGDGTSSSALSIKLSPGDPIALCHENNLSNPIARGVVYKLNDENDAHISLCFNQWLREHSSKVENQIVCFIQSSDEATLEKLLKLTEQMQNYYGKCPGANLVEYLFGRKIIPKAEDIRNRNPILHFTNDESKNKVVDFCINDQRPICLIHGPPGTGKTTCLAKIVQILIQNGKKVLACAPSNVAVDNMIEKFSLAGLDPIRLGHPMRAFSNLRDNCLDYRLQKSDRQNEIEDLRDALDKLNRERPGQKAKKQKMDKYYKKFKFLKTKLWFENDMALRGISSSTNLVCCTLTNAISSFTEEENDYFSTYAKFLSKFTHFDCVIIDECSQATEVACWGALLRGKRCILAGDPDQLSATVLSEEAKDQGFGKSLMQRIMEEFPSDSVRNQMLQILTLQFRMHEFIMRWSSKNIYNNVLNSADCVKDHLLCDLEHVKKTPETSTPLIFLDTSQARMYEFSSANGQSKANLGEVSLVRSYVKTLVNLGVKQKEIAVIAPYNLQIHHLRQQMLCEFPDICINSIDAFQGQEKEVVVLSLVRSNIHGALGFLTDRRRINVAVTRARRQLVIIGNADFMAENDQTMRSLVDHFREYGIFKPIDAELRAKIGEEENEIVAGKLDLKMILQFGPS